MTTPYDGKLLLVTWRGITTPGDTPAKTAALLRQRMPNVAGIMLKTSNGVSWQGTLGNDRGPKAITGVRRIADWVEAFAAEGLEVHVWGVPRGRQPDDINREAEKFIDAANVPGVSSLLLDVEHGEYYWQGTPLMARALVDAIRRRLPNTHIGLILDGRRNRSFEYWVEPWLSGVDSLHPMVYPILFGRDRSIEEHLGRAYDNLLPYLKPIYPMLQSCFAGDRPTADEILHQGLAAARAADGMSFYRLGVDPSPIDQRPVMEDDAYDAIAAIPAIGRLATSSPSGLESLEALGVYTWGQVIDATYNTAASVGAGGSWWGWLASHPRQVPYKPEMNKLPYDGAPVGEWPIDPAHRAQILSALVSSYGQLDWAPARGTTPPPTPPPQPQPQPVAPKPQPQPPPQPATPKPQPPPPTPPPSRPAAPARPAGSAVGIHGHPAPVTPPLDQWDEWIGYLKGMGVRWYKQLDWGNPADMQPDSTFAWASRLKREGIEPIIRFYKSEQFPGRLDGFMFDKMRLYAERDIRWVEIGNEPNLDYEWKSDWRARVAANDAETIRVLAEGWLADAKDAIAAGARPALYAFGPTDWESGRPHPRASSVNFTRNMVRYLADHHRAATIDVFKRGGWIAVHVATYDRALDFDPYGVQPPWDMALRGYEVPRRALRDAFGNDLDVNAIPIISTEGGVFTQDCKYLSDRQKARGDADHAAAVVAMYNYVERSTPLLAMCPWCLTTINTHDDKFAGDGWIIEQNGGRRGRAVTDALRQLRFDNDRRREDNQPGRGRVKLAISHMSQQDTTASQRGDCGPTCLAMMINVQRATPLTIDEMYRDTAVLKPKIGKSGPQSYTSWWEMGEVAKAYGLATDQPTYQTAEIALAELRRHVRNGTPLVALVNYGRWTDLPDIAENRFDGPHFVLVTGVDEEYVFIHDPLFTFARRQKGTHFPLSNARFLDAWGNLSGDNPNYSALVPRWQVGRVEALG